MTGIARFLITDEQFRAMTSTEREAWWEAYRAHCLRQGETARDAQRDADEEREGTYR